MAQIIGDAVARYEEDELWHRAREGYERMNADPQDRASFDEELGVWDATLQDGLRGFPYDEPTDESTAARGSTWRGMTSRFRSGEGS